METDKKIIKLENQVSKLKEKVKKHSKLIRKLKSDDEDYEYPEESNVTCFKCKEEGHYANQCSNISKITCWKCGCLGHYANQCCKK
jgi:hypothetical protein